MAAADHQLRSGLNNGAMTLAAGAVLIEGEPCLDGSEAVSRLLQK